MSEEIKCIICDSATLDGGTARGIRTGRDFALRRCSSCGFAFVKSPWTDYSQIYDEAYYEGRGSDPLIDYAFEFKADDSTVRLYEWSGWNQLIHQIKPEPVKWLDFGCGCGTLVRYISSLGRDEIYGFDRGAWAEKARNSGVPVLTKEELASHEGTFDVVTAIDVIEHVAEPHAMLEHCRRLLKPGGILIPITGNAEIVPPQKLAEWSYVSPEIHVSFFTPDAMGQALRRAGFIARPLPREAGWRGIIRARILKNLRIKRRSLIEKIAPWRLLAPLADSIYKMGRMPIGEAI